MIRRLHKSDIEQVAKLWLSSTKQAHPFIAAKYWDENLSKVEDLLASQAQTYLYVDKHQIKGFISLLDKEYIGALFVKPIYQSQKIGSKLLRYVLRNKTSASLKVYTNNEPAINFYRFHGFKIIQESKDLSTQAQELIMAWSKGSHKGLSRLKGDS